MSKNLIALRLEQETIEKIKEIAPEGNVSMWIRVLVNKELKRIDEVKENK